VAAKPGGIVALWVAVVAFLVMALWRLVETALGRSTDPKSQGASSEVLDRVKLSDGEWTPADVSHDPSLVATFNTGRDATTGNTSSAPGADSIRSVKLRSGPSPPLLIRTSRSQ
jgi:hypothetical protein